MHLEQLCALDLRYDGEFHYVSPYPGEIIVSRAAVLELRSETDFVMDSVWSGHLR